MDRQQDGGTAALTQYTWERQPEAERLVRELTEEFLRKCPETARLAERMKAETGTRFGDWIDSIHLRETAEWRERLLRAGYSDAGDSRFVHRGGMFPPVHLRDT